MCCLRPLLPCSNISLWYRDSSEKICRTPRAHSNTTLSCLFLVRWHYILLNALTNGIMEYFTSIKYLFYLWQVIRNQYTRHYSLSFNGPNIKQTKGQYHYFISLWHHNIHGIHVIHVEAFFILFIHRPIEKVSFSKYHSTRVNRLVYMHKKLALLKSFIAHCKN